MKETKNSKSEVAYIFKECDRKIQEPRDNKQREGGMTLYGKEDGSRISGTFGE